MSRAWIFLLPLAALLPSAHLAWTQRQMPHLGVQHDDGVQFVTAQALAQSSEYRIESLPGRPFQTRYPPLYPLYLSAVWKLEPRFPDNLPLATLFAWVLLPVFLAAAFLAFRDLGLGSLHAAALCAVLALNIQVQRMSVTLVPDLVSTAALLAGFYAAGRRPDSDWTAVAAGVLGAAAFLLKSLLLPVLISTPVWLLFQRRRRRAALFVAAMLPFVLAWMWWQRTHVTPGAPLFHTDYLGFYLRNVSWATLPGMVWDNVQFALFNLAFMVTPAPNLGNLVDPLWAVLGLAGLAAVAAEARFHGLRSYHVFGAALLPELLLWNFPPDHRLTLPLYPLMLAGVSSYLVRGARRLHAQLGAASPLRRAGALGGTVGIAAAAALFVTTNTANAAQASKWVRELGQRTSANRDAYAWIARHCPAGSTFLAFDDPLVWLHTGHRSARAQVSSNTFYSANRRPIYEPFLALDRRAAELGLTHVLLTPRDFVGDLKDSERRLIREAALNNPRLRLCFRREDTAVLEVGGAVP